MTRTNVGGAYVGDFSSNSTCKRLHAGLSPAAPLLGFIADFYAPSSCLIV